MTEVIRQNEILLNNKFYKLNGSVRPRVASTFPSKIVIGDYTQEDEQIASSWIISDQRGGIGVEELDEEIQGDRSFFSNCNTRFKGHIILPPLATEVTLPTTTAPTIVNADMELETGWTNGARSSTVKHGGTYSWKLIDGGVDAYQDLATTQIAGRRFTVTGWIYQTAGGSGSPNQAHIGIYDGTTTTWSADSATEGSWVSRTVTATLKYGATTLRIYFSHPGDGTQPVYYDDVAITRNDYGYPVVACNFNSQTYWGFSGGLLGKIDSVAGASILGVYEFASGVADLATSLSSLFILLGTSRESPLAEDLTDVETDADVDDGTQFIANDYARIDNEIVLVTAIATNTLTITRAQWGTTGGAHLTDAIVTNLGQSYYITKTTEVATLCKAGGKLGVDWDSKFCFLDATNQLSYISAVGGTPTLNGQITEVPAGAVKSLYVYRNASGDPIIYAGATSGLWAHVYASAKWLETELSLPDHPTGGRGLTRWHDALFISAGLDVKRYIAGTTAIIESMGLDRDDGIPTLYRGEMVDLTKGYTEFFTLVDSSLVTGTGYSTIMIYDGTAWHCIWVDGTADQAMRCGIVSSVYDYRFWWGVASKIYYITLQRNIQNPLYITSYPYALAAVHTTGRFDAGTAWNKRAIRVKVIADKISAGNEAVVVYYRTNAFCYTDYASNWTSLGTIIADGETTLPFASSAGLLFKVIQFRFELSRRAGDNTKTPDLQRVSLVYEKTLPAAWGWDMEIDLTKGYRGYSPETMWQNLKALVGGVLVPFSFTHEDGTVETNYVEIATLAGSASTGKEKQGTYQLGLIAP